MSKDKEIKEIVNTNQTLLVLLGYATSIIFSLQEIIDDNHCSYDERLLDKIGWLKEAIENVVYKNVPAPKMP